MKMIRKNNIEIPQCCGSELTVLELKDDEICLHCVHCWDGTEPHKTLEKAINEWKENEEQ